MYFMIFQGHDGLWYWRLRAANHEIIAHGEGYHNRGDCLHAVELVKSSKDAPVIER